MPTKRAGTKSSAASSPPGGNPIPLVNAVLLGGALSYGLSLLVMGGRVTWPPHQLLASLFTVAGCLALVGPLLLWRVDGGERGLGELMWMSGGVVVWIFDAAAAFRGTIKPSAWAAPLGHEAMGLTMLAILVSGWRCYGLGRTWSWTNVTGWVLGIFWVGMAIKALVAGGGIGAYAR